MGKGVTNLVYHNTFSIPVDKENENMEYDFKVSISEFFVEYKKVAKFGDFLCFEWNLSSGEMALLNMFSRFYSIVRKDNGKYYLPDK